jgi:beta-glucanase (GH16 family)
MNTKKRNRHYCPQVDRLDGRLLLSSLTDIATPAPTATLAATSTPTSPTTLPAPIAGTNYQLVFDDEFNGTSINTAKWNEVGPWGQPVSSTLPGEKYLASNVTETPGLATITAQTPGSTWTSGILSTNGLEQFQYGFIDVRAKLPASAGFWPAIWMYGANSSSQELDIMEFLGTDVTQVYQTMHEASGAYEQVASTSTNWTSSYHDFEMLWEPGQVTFYIDNVETASFTTNVPSEAMYLMINFDVGAATDWSGGANASTPSPAQFDIQYVRVYQIPP